MAHTRRVNGVDEERTKAREGKGEHGQLGVRFFEFWAQYLVNVLIPEGIFPVLDGIADLLCHVSKEIVLDQRDVEAFIVLERVEPFPTDVALIQ